MADYLQTRADAEADIRSDGVVVTLSRTSAGTYDPATDTTTGATTTTWSVPALIKAPSINGGGWRWMPGALVQVGDIELLAGADTLGKAGVQPKPVDKVAVAAGEWAGTYTVEATVPVAPGGVAVLFRVLGRRS